MPVMSRYHSRRNKVHPEPSVHAIAHALWEEYQRVESFLKRLIDDGGVVEGFGLVIARTSLHELVYRKQGGFGVSLLRHAAKCA